MRPLAPALLPSACICTGIVETVDVRLSAGLSTVGDCDENGEWAGESGDSGDEGGCGTVSWKCWGTKSRSGPLARNAVSTLILLAARPLGGSLSAPSPLLALPLVFVLIVGRSGRCLAGGSLGRTSPGRMESSCSSRNNSSSSGGETTSSSLPARLIARPGPTDAVRREEPEADARKKTVWAE